jgi:hypothetical protein
LAFLDEEQPYAPRRAPAPRRRGPERQQIMARRVIAAAVGLLILILLILGIKGCLHARKQRGLENFASDVNTLVVNSDQLSESFFKELESPGASGLGLSQAVEADRGTAESLLTRAEQISAPGDLTGAKGSLVEAFQLRRDGIAGLAATLATVTSKVQHKQVSLAVDHMKELVASDVIYVRAKDQIDQALAAEGLQKDSPKPSVFVLQPTQWLDPTVMEGVLGSAGTTGGGNACPSTKGTFCGVALVSTAIGGATLSTSAPVTVTGSAVDVSVQNQGNVDETNVQVSYRLSGGGSGSGSGTIPKLAAGATKTVSLPIKPAPASGTSLTIAVSVQPVPGEQVSSNNKATYSVTFG